MLLSWKMQEALGFKKEYSRDQVTVDGHEGFIPTLQITAANVTAWSSLKKAWDQEPNLAQPDKNEIARFQLHGYTAALGKARFTLWRWNFGGCGSSVENWR